MYTLLGDRTSEVKGIREFPDATSFEFYIAGYTKKCQGFNVQSNHAKIMSYALQVNKLDSKTTKEILWPFGEASNLVTVQLKHESNNPFDEHAMIIEATVPLNIKEALLNPKGCDTTSFVLGYVPKSISKIIHENINSIRVGKVKKVKLVNRDKFCSTKVSFQYRLPKKTNKTYFTKRFSSILE